MMNNKTVKCYGNNFNLFETRIKIFLNFIAFLYLVEFKYCRYRTNCRCTISIMSSSHTAHREINRLSAAMNVRCRRRHDIISIRPSVDWEHILGFLCLGAHCNYNCCINGVGKGETKSNEQTKTFCSVCRASFFLYTYCNI